MDMDMDMDMASTTMPSMTSAATPSSTAMSGMGGMDMGGGSSGACKISMMWNWNTIDSCFISSTWRITSKGMFAGSCIGVILLVMSLEFLRRLGHEYDKYIIGKSRFFQSKAAPCDTPSQHDNSKDDAVCSQPLMTGKRVLHPTLFQHTVRSLLHMVQFGVAYFIMLLAMYYNGYFIICILIGSFLGSFVFSWKSLEKNDATEVTVCCG